MPNAVVHFRPRKGGGRGGGLAEALSPGVGLCGGARGAQPPPEPLAASVLCSGPSWASQGGTAREARRVAPSGGGGNPTVRARL